MKNRIFSKVILIIGFVLILLGCKKELSEKRYTTDDQKLIESYVEGNDSLTIMAKLLQRAGKSSVLNSYGSYTLFAPTNKAFTNYIAQLGKGSIDELTDDEVNYLINYHILTNKVTLRAQNIGLVNDTTVNGLHVLYMLQGNDIIINKVATVTNTVEVSNGLIYVLNAVLDPPASTIYDYLKNSGIYNIMTSVMEQTGLKDTLQTIQIPNPYTDLNLPIGVRLTLFVESDNVLKNKGIANFDALKQAVWENSKSWATDADQALNAFARYHLIQDFKFLYQLYPNDGKNEFNLVTYALNRSKVIHTNAFLNQLPILNADTSGGNIVGGISFNNALSDKILKNGIVHQLDGILYMPNITPRATYVIRECEHNFRGYLNSALNYNYVFLQDARISNGTLGLQLNNQFTTDEYYYFGNGAAVQFTPQDVGDYIEFDIKDLAPGKYSVYLNYRRDQTYSSQNVNVYFWKSSQQFDIKSTPIYAGLDMANMLNTAPADREFSQMKSLSLTPIEITEFGDYTIRFVHADLRMAIYDSIILKPEN